MRPILPAAAVAAVVCLLFATSASADQVIADDLIVQGSNCVGLDCVNNESFGFDTLRLKENNTRIKFDDTSASPGFPANDWTLSATPPGAPPIERSGKAMEVVRRQPDGSWRVAIDDPFARS